ncbi:MAG: allophanate hydrolase [Actinomycetia bacterium]|nr:allophanate hydrolase [Actinomycetes bacterium]
MTTAERATAGAVLAAYERLCTIDDPALVVALVDEADVRARVGALTATESGDRPLFGIPTLVKDNIAVAGLPTTAGCPAYATTPASASAAVVERLEEAGAVVLGTTNMDQFATGLVGTRSPYGTPRNPVAPDRIPGGSSSGSAVAVARGIVPFALGTDTAGSGRVPAACTNTVGLKPTRGLVSTRGVVPAVPGLDCISVHALTVADAFRVLAAISGFDARDPSTRTMPLQRGPGRGFPTVGWLADAVVDVECERAIARSYRDTRVVVAGISRDRGLDVDLTPAFAAGAQLYGPWVAARYAAFGTFVDAHPDAVDPVVARVVSAGRAVTGAEVFAAQHELMGLACRTNALFSTVDVLVVPTIPFFPSLDEVAADPIGVNARLSRFTDFVNLLDLCAVAAPGAPRADGLPFGVTVIAPAGADALVADVAARLHATVGGTLGATSRPVPEDPWPDPTSTPALGGTARVAVVGAHLRGMPLHHELAALGARFDRCTRTAPRYRLYALSGSVPPKPGLVRDDDRGAAIEIEVYALGEAELGRFVAGVAAPLALGPIELDDGTTMPGFVAAAGALDSAIDITHHGGWRTYMESRRTG